MMNNKCSVLRRFAALILAATIAGCTAEDEYYVIDHFNIKEEGDAFRDAFRSLTCSTYQWYRTIENQEGVYIVHYDYYSAELMQEWKKNGIYKTVPEEDLHYLCASLNYLEDCGLELTEEEKTLVKDGVRLYLLPDTLTDEETETMKAFLTEDALFGIDGETLIDTTFNHDRRIEFRTYSHHEALDTLGSGEVTDPVIYAAGCQNMTFFESESLIATGKKDGYIKLSAEAYRKCAGKNLPDELKDRKVTFLGLSKAGD